jgi:D-amino peptidase
MRVFVSIDLEGVAGVADRRQVARGTDDFEHARGLMAGEANAVARGAFAAGADTVVVNDSHGDLCNLRPGDLDERVLLQIGSGKTPNGMVFRADTGFDAALFVGYHARAGTAGGVLEHSYSSATISGIRVNGADWGETELNAAVVGSFGIPVVLVAGDDLVCAQAAAVLPEVRTVAVKDGLGFRAARSLSPALARARLEEAARECLSATALPAPFRPPGPFRLEIDFLTTAMAEAASLVPGSQRVGARTVGVDAATVDELSRYRGVFTVLAGTAVGI